MNPVIILSQPLKATLRQPTSIWRYRVFPGTFAHLSWPSSSRCVAGLSLWLRGMSLYPLVGHPTPVPMQRRPLARLHSSSSVAAEDPTLYRGDLCAPFSRLPPGYIRSPALNSSVQRGPLRPLTPPPQHAAGSTLYSAVLCRGDQRPLQTSSAGCRLNPIQHSSVQRGPKAPLPLLLSTLQALRDPASTEVSTLRLRIVGDNASGRTAGEATRARQHSTSKQGVPIGENFCSQLIVVDGSATGKATRATAGVSRESEGHKGVFLVLTPCTNLRR